MMRLRQTRGPILGGALLAGIAACMMSTSSARADLVVTVDPGALTNGFMNVFNLPADGGAFQFASPWGVPDLVATWSGSDVTLSPNTIGDPDPYWYIGGGAPGNPGNKIMEANIYNEVGGDQGLVTFSGTVLANTLTSAHSSIAFIKDFAPDYSSSVDSIVALPASGDFSISLGTIADAGRHIQYGFATTGENVWVTDTAPFGSVTIGAIPEPSTLVLGSLGFIALARRMRRRSV